MSASETLVSMATDIETLRSMLTREVLKREQVVAQCDALTEQLARVTAARDILGGHLRDWHDEEHAGNWDDCEKNECLETRHFLAAGQTAPAADPARGEG